MMLSGHAEDVAQLVEVLADTTAALETKSAQVVKYEAELLAHAAEVSGRWHMLDLMPRFPLSPCMLDSYIGPVIPVEQ